MKKMKETEMIYDLSKFYNGVQADVPHCIIHLSKTQHKRYKNNSIHLTGRHYVGDMLLYNNVTWGSNIVTKLKKLNTSEGYMWSKVLQMDQIKSNMVMITTSISDVQADIKTSKVVVMEGTNRTVASDSGDDKYSPSEVALLAILNTDRSHNGMLK